MPLLYRKKLSNGKVKVIEVDEKDVKSYLDYKVASEGKLVSSPWSKENPDKKAELEYSPSVKNIPETKKS